ncbi:MAG: asparaginase domain-containing protein [Microthrixaceae bacterium]
MAVTLIATGGTIASTRDADGGVTASLTGADLVDALDPADLSACGGPTEIDVVDAPVPGSWNMSTARAQQRSWDWRPRRSPRVPKEWSSPTALTCSRRPHGSPNCWSVHGTTHRC